MTWLTISALCSVFLNHITELYSILSSFIIMVSSSSCAAITMGMSVSVYPTNIRAMATSFIFTCGRIGGLIGANFVSLLLEHQCTLIFNMSAVFLISKLQNCLLLPITKFVSYHRGINLYSFNVFTFNLIYRLCRSISVDKKYHKSDQTG